MSDALTFVESAHWGHLLQNLLRHRPRAILLWSLDSDIHWDIRCATHNQCPHQVSVDGPPASTHSFVPACYWDSRGLRICSHAKHTLPHEPHGAPLPASLKTVSADSIKLEHAKRKLSLGGASVKLSRLQTCRSNSNSASTSLRHNWNFGI